MKQALSRGVGEKWGAYGGGLEGVRGCETSKSKPVGYAHRQTAAPGPPVVWKIGVRACATPCHDAQPPTRFPHDECFTSIAQVGSKERLMLALATTTARRAVSAQGTHDACLDLI